MKTLAKTSSKRRRRKQRKTFSLSQNAVAYLEDLRWSRGAESLTAAVETLIREQQQREALERLNQEITAYYDSLTDEEVAEHREWGEFAGRALLETLKQEEKEK